MVLLEPDESNKEREREREVEIRVVGPVTRERRAVSYDWSAFVRKVVRLCRRGRE
jgi:hypothetical protein